MNNLLLPCPFFLTFLCIVLASSQIQQNDPLESFIVRDPLNPDNIRYELPQPPSAGQSTQPRTINIPPLVPSSVKTNSSVFTLPSLDSEDSNPEPEHNSAPPTSIPTIESSKKRIQLKVYNPHQQTSHATNKGVEDESRFLRSATVGEMMEQWPKFAATLKELQRLSDADFGQSEKARYYEMAATFHGLYDEMGGYQFNHEFGKIQLCPDSQLAAPLKEFALQKCFEWSTGRWGVKAKDAGVEEWRRFLAQYTERCS